jgi:hypothetical protein
VGERDGGLGAEVVLGEQVYGVGAPVPDKARSPVARDESGDPLAEFERRDRCGVAVLGLERQPRAREQKDADIAIR